jgi:tetratricopeptide (TPR) repeat protein
MKKGIWLLLFVGFLAIVLFVGKNAWIELSRSATADQNSQPSYKTVMDRVRKVLKWAPFASVHYVLANSYSDEGLEDQAIEEYKKALQFNKHFVQAYLALSEIYLRKELYLKAMELLRKAEASIPNNPEVKELQKQASSGYFIETGVKAFEEGDRVRARELLNKALEADPNSAQTHYVLALSFDEQQDFQQVEDHLKEAIRLDPKFYLARSFLGDLYFGKGDFEKAIEQYEFAIAITNDDPAVFNNMGLAYMNLERYGSAIPNLEKAIALNPTNVETRHNLAAVYRDYGMLDKAAESFVGIIRMNPGYPNVHNDLGNIYRKQGRDQEALKEYRATIAYGQKRLLPSSRDPQLLVELAHAYSQIKEYETAKKLVDEALAANPNDSNAYLTLANIYRNSNQLEAALDVLDKAKKASTKKYLFIDEIIADIKEQMARSKPERNV